jgi:hypothetical protein
MNDTGDDEISGGTDDVVGTDDEIDRLREENEALKSRLESRAGWRRALALLLVVLTSLSLVSSSIAVWAHERVFNTEKFMELIGPALDEPAFYAVLSDKVSAQVLDALDIEPRVAAALTNLDAYLSEALLDAVEIDEQTRQLLDRFERPSLAALAPSIAEALEGRVVGRIDQFFTSDEFATRFPSLVSRVHSATISLVRGELAELPNVYIEAGEVRLNLIPIIAEALRPVVEDVRGILPDIELPAVVSEGVSQGRDQLAAAIDARLPDDFGQVTVMTEQDLAEAQAVAGALDRYVWGLVLLTLVLATLTVVVSPNRRRTTLHLGLGVVVAITIAAVALRRVQAAVLEQATTPGGEQAVRALLGGVSSNLRTVELIVALAAVVVAVVAYLAGRPPWLSEVSGRVRNAPDRTEGGSDIDRWIAQHYDLLRIAGAGLALLVFFIIGFDLLAVIVIAVVLGVYMWAISEARSRATAPMPETVMASAGTELEGDAE